MLVEGMSAQLVPSPARERWLQQIRKARDAVEIVAGGCACDLVGRRLESVEKDERRLREAFRRRRIARSEAIRVLDRHRTRPPEGARPNAADFGAFVAEHARNAGPALYYLQPSVGGPDSLSLPAGPPLSKRVSEVLADVRGWLAAEIPTSVVP